MRTRMKPIVIVEVDDGGDDSDADDDDDDDVEIGDRDGRGECGERRDYFFFFFFERRGSYVTMIRGYVTRYW